MTNKTAGRSASRLRMLKERFGRPHVVVERDRTKKGDVGAGAMHGKHAGAPRYEDKIVALVRSGFTVLYSECEVGTAQVISTIAKAERAKGFSMDPRWFIRESSHTKQVVRLLLEAPNINYAVAQSVVNCSLFRSLGDLCRSASAESLQQSCHGLGLKQAEGIVEFFRSAPQPNDRN